MSFPHRVRTVYVKELIDILRDRRTLIAMIVVPIVLYPLLMLGSIQAISMQGESLQNEKILIGLVANPVQREALRRLASEEAKYLEATRRNAETLKSRNAETSESRKLEGEEELPPPINESAERRFYPNELAIKIAVRNREIQVGLVFDDEITDDPRKSNVVTPYYDKEEIRSLSAHSRVRDMIERANERFMERRKRQWNLPPSFDRPFILESVDLSSPPSILGQILPLILVLMTITGAIYPAIDLTAGERERGTLETLMVCPVPTIDLIFGKFLVVTTIAIMGATLNLGSVCATVYFGGFDAFVASGDGRVPYGQLLLILVCLIPFAVLMSAIMLAVCSYARTFKEAQNYVTPVILAVLIPGGIAALPATRLEGIMLVVPVGNMVLLARELLIGAQVPAVAMLMVLLSTTLYAAAAVAVAAKVFGKESVVFADAGSIKGVLTRRLIKPSATPTLTMALLVVALLFPTWYFAQTSLSGGRGGDAASVLRVLRGTGVWMPVFFVLTPLAIMLYGKVSPKGGFALRLPGPRYVVAAVLFGLSAWVPAAELGVLQNYVLETPRALNEFGTALTEALRAMPIALALLYIAMVPGICEEFLFRGFLLSGLRRAAGKWTSIVVSAVIFGVFHFMIFRIPVTAALGIVLALLCWQSRSIWPGVIMHVIHNGIGGLSAVRPDWFEALGIPNDVEQAGEHLPPLILLAGGTMFLIAWMLVSRGTRRRSEPQALACADVRAG